MLTIAKRDLRQDPALTAAFLAAGVVAAVLGDDRHADRADWAQLHDAKRTDDAAAFVAVRDRLAPFVRQYPDAPAEALYRHAADVKVHAGAAGGFAAQPAPLQLAYAVFVRELTALDAALKDGRPAARPMRRRKFPDEESVLAKNDGVGDKVDGLGTPSRRRGQKSGRGEEAR